jgi:hypothetical protein
VLSDQLRALATAFKRKRPALAGREGDRFRMSRAKITLASVLVALSLAGLGASAVQAHPPTWHTKRAVLAGALKFNAKSMTSRLWVSGLKIVIVCGKDKGSGEIEQKAGEAGINKKVVATFEECKVFEIHLNAVNQSIAGSELTVCAVKSSGEGAGIIKTNELKSELAYWPLSEEKFLVDVLKPTAGETFTTIEISGTECAATLKKAFEVKGSVIARIPRNNEEAIMGDLLFQVRNNSMTVAQWPEYYESEADAKEGTEEGLTKDVLTFGANPTAFESTDQIELENLEPFGAFI